VEDVFCDEDATQVRFSSSPSRPRSRGRRKQPNRKL
jgi:hypothetical protein